jgi:subtilisin family serine protease
VKIGIVDTGVDGDHPALRGRIAAARSFAGGDPLYPDSTHGTMVAGLIAGDAAGVGGLAPTAQLVVARVSSPDGGYPPAAIAAAIRWTVDQGARVVNVSLAGPSETPSIAAAVAYAVRHDVLVVAAAGNCFPACGAASAAQRPAADPHVLAVAALNAGATGLAGFSVVRSADLAAPGERLTTLLPVRNSPYTVPADCPYAGTTACLQADSSGARWGPSGTSYAAPLVAAAAGLLFAARPRLHAAQAARLLTATARPVPGARIGVLQVGAALSRALATPR